MSFDDDSFDRAQRDIDAAAQRSLRQIRRDKVDLGVCNYYTGKGDRICSATGGLCAVLGEPLCTTEVPAEGWPSENEGGETWT